MHGSLHSFEHLPQVAAAAASDRPGWANAPVRARPLVGVIRNLRSHRNLGRAFAEDGGPDTIIACPRKRGELPAILADFAARQVDFIAMDGGDGTIRDVLTCGAAIYGESWPGLIVIPSGKTNALANDLGVPARWTLDEGLAAARRGTVVRRHALQVTQKGNAGSLVQGFVMGGGAFTWATRLGMKSHRIGAVNNVVVALAAVWSAGQALLGAAGNRWRRGTTMHVRLGDGQELPHLGGLPLDERYLLFASTLRRFPAGLNPFRGLDDPLRIGVIDNPSRKLLLRIGAIFRGTTSAATRARGLHMFGADAIEWDTSDDFILDGEVFPAGQYRIACGPALRFVVP